MERGKDVDRERMVHHIQRERERDADREAEQAVDKHFAESLKKYNQSQVITERFWVLLWYANLANMSGGSHLTTYTNIAFNIIRKYPNGFNSILATFEWNATYLLSR